MTRLFVDQAKTGANQTDTVKDQDDLSFWVRHRRAERRHHAEYVKRPEARIK